MTVLIP